ncbi:MAG: hypothetical protein ACFE8U_04640 [Candidatus Hermodarchaeota archaeon]
MVNILDLVFLGFMEFLNWYTNDVLNASDLLEFFLKQFLFYLFLQIIMYLIPFIRKVLNIVCLPFRWTHVYLHIYAAKEVLKEIETKKEEEEYDEIVDKASLRSSLISGIDTPDENPGLLMAFNRLEYAKKVALAPNRLAFIMLIGYLIVTPFAFVDGILFSTQGAFIHFYLFLGIFGVMMPSLNDWYFIFHALIINLDIRPKYFYNSILVYIVFVFDYIWRTKNFFVAIFASTIWFLFYLTGLFVVGYIAQKGELRNPKIYWVPVKYSKERFFSKSEVEFLSLEDLDK